MSTDRDSQSRSARARTLESRVWDCLGGDAVQQAISRCEQLNREHPEYAAGWHTASHLALRLGNSEEALVAIDRALSLQPESVAWLLQKALVCLKLARIDDVAALVTQIRARKLKTAYQCSAFAMLLTRLERREEAIEFYEQAARLSPEDAKHFYNIACLQRSLGEIEAAERNFDEAIRLNPVDYEAWKVRSDLRTQTADHNHVGELEALLRDGIEDERGAVQVGYALAKELEDLGDTERAFRCLKTAADSRRGYMQYDVQRDLDTMAAIEKTFDAIFFAGSPVGCDNPEAIFVLGLPRTGTTLVERILASHPDVHSAGELTNFAVEMMKLVRSGKSQGTPSREKVVATTADLDFRRLGEAYIDSTRPLTGRTLRFIDKLPLNYLYIGLIHQALPKAKIVALRRHPLDTCYAIFKQLFVDAYPFSYDLEELGRYYVAYDRLMAHWNTVVPGTVHVVQYEALVADLETQTRSLLDYCELGWDAQCLRYYANRDATTTASSTQVRQPVYSSSIGRWRDYEAHLAPLIRVLEDAGIALDR